MNQLLADAAIAAVTLLDRAMTAVVHTVRRPASPPPGAGAQPTGTGASSATSSPGAGGHSNRPTSELLGEAVCVLGWAHHDNPSAVIRELQADLRDRAAQFSAIGD